MRKRSDSLQNRNRQFRDFFHGQERWIDENAITRKSGSGECKPPSIAQRPQPQRGITGRTNFFSEQCDATHRDKHEYSWKYLKHAGGVAMLILSPVAFAAAVTLQLFRQVVTSCH